MGGKSIHKGAERLFLCAIPYLSLSNSVYHPPCGKVPVSGIFFSTLYQFSYWAFTLTRFIFHSTNEFTE
jgi:hypothetical protein